ncbi:DUF5723 family protein [Robiginitalea sp. IMCC44478]|uniref:DUF5723 family protein n=1 Tax=Robiginitalea sp. IMCC44478 TaxID=3459122 RepID=UPI0040424A2C
MRRILCLLAFSIGLGWGLAQNKQILYDFREIPQALMVNPGTRTAYNWYAGIPMLSGISFQAGSSGISVNDIFADDGLDINDKIRDRAIFGMSTRDELSGTYQVELLSGGFRSRNRPNDFYSFGIYNEGDAIGYWFRDLAILAWEGNADRLGQRFDLGHLKTRGEMLNVFHFGINRRVNNRLTAGVRAKIYSGIISFKSTRNSGYFVTQPGQNNLLANTLRADMLLQTSGLESIRQTLSDNGGNEVQAIRQHLLKRGFFGGDLGLGVDLGFTYALNGQLELTASLLDLGFMMHSGDVRNFSLAGQATVEGVEVILPDALADPNRDFWQDLVDEVEGLIPFDEDNRSYISFRPTKLYSSLRYNFGEADGTAGAWCDCSYRVNSRSPRAGYRNAVGIQLYAINRPRGPQTAWTLFYQRNFGRILGMKATYTADKFTQTNLGLGVNLQAGPVNFYVMADNLLAYRNIAAANYASFQIGLNILSWNAN